MTMDIEGPSASEQQDTQMSDSTPSLWHKGTPAEAISHAISHQKLFLVNIQPPSESSVPSASTVPPSSSSWDTVWTNEEVKAKLLEHAVCLNMTQGSTDATMFLQLIGFPAEATGVWIVFAGRLLDTFTSSDPPTTEEMLQRIQSTITKSEEIKSQPVIPPPAVLESPSIQSTTSSQPVPQPQNSAIQSQLAARRAKMEAAKEQHDKEMKEARKAAAERQASSSDPERQKYITQQARERAAQKAQRARILAEIENDKAERKARAERAKQGSSGTGHPNTSINNIVSGNTNSTNIATNNTATGPSTNIAAAGTARFAGLTKLSIRQPDSKIIKVEFETNKTLSDVRKWIDTNRTDGTSPYVLQTTFPTRTFEVSEESETVGSIFGKGGQCVMKEIKIFSEAYSSTAPGVVGLASSLLGSVTGTLSNVLGWSDPQNTNPSTIAGINNQPGASGIGAQGTGTSGASGISDNSSPRPGEAIREARIRNVNYSARERGVVSDEGDGERERNWFNGNGLAQEAPPRDGEKRD